MEIANLEAWRGRVTANDTFDPVLGGSIMQIAAWESLHPGQAPQRLPKAMWATSTNVWMSPVVGSFLAYFAKDCDDAIRQELLRFLPEAVKTRDAESQRFDRVKDGRRMFHAMTWACSVVTLLRPVEMEGFKSAAGPDFSFQQQLAFLTRPEASPPMDDLYEMFWGLSHDAGHFAKFAGKIMANRPLDGLACIEQTLGVTDGEG